MKSFQTETRQTDMFQAKDASGQPHWIIERTEFIETTNLQSKGREWTPGMKSYVTRDGDILNWTGPKEFTVVSTGQILTKI